MVTAMVTAIYAICILLYYSTQTGHAKTTSAKWNGGVPNAYIYVRNYVIGTYLSHFFDEYVTL
jgi:hypothetical protein